MTDVFHRGVLTAFHPTEGLWHLKADGDAVAMFHAPPSSFVNLPGPAVGARYYFRVGVVNGLNCAVDLHAIG